MSSIRMRVKREVCGWNDGIIQQLLPVSFLRMRKLLICMLNTELFNLYTATTYIRLSRCFYNVFIHKSLLPLQAPVALLWMLIAQNYRSSLLSQDQQINPRRARVRGARVQYSRAQRPKLANLGADRFQLDDPRCGRCSLSCMNCF